MFKNSEMREILQEIEEFIEQEKKEGGIFENVEEYAKKRLLFDDQSAKKYAENFEKYIYHKMINHSDYLLPSCREKIKKYFRTGKADGIIAGDHFKNDQFEKLGITLDTKLIEEYIEISKKSFSEDFLISLLKRLGDSIRSQMLKIKYNNMPIDMIGYYSIVVEKKHYVVIVDKIAVLVLLDEEGMYHNYLFWDHVFTFKT